MPVIHLVRHAQPDFHGNYDSLTELGYEQSRWLGEHYSSLGIRFARIVSGSLVRQGETARAISERLPSAPAIAIDARLNEYDLAQVLGQTGGSRDRELRDRGDRKAYFTAVRSGLLAWSSLTDAPSDGGESWLDFGERVQAALEMSCDGVPREGRVLIVTSGGVIGRIVARVLGADSATAIALNLQARNTGITELVAGRSATRLVQFNSIPHLERADRMHAQTYS
jgi:broad specificity phosphatase PhoE